MNIHEYCYVCLFTNIAWSFIEKKIGVHSLLKMSQKDKTRQDNGEKRMQALVPLYPYHCYTLH